MALNHDLEGKVYPTVRFTLEEARVRAFAHAVGQRRPGVPPTIVTAPEIEAGLRNVVADPELGVAPSRLLHGEQEYVWSRVAVVGETLTAETVIQSIRSRGAMEFLILGTEIRGDAGDLVASGRCTLIVRGGG